MFIATIEEKSQTVSGIFECYKMQGNPMTSFVYLKSKIAIHNPVSSNLNSHKLFYNLYWLFQATTKRHKTGSYS